MHAVGPGEYDVNDSPTKYRNPEIDFGKQSDKPRGIPVVESNVGPGAYQDKKKFGDDAKTFKIRDPSPEKPADPSGGPGQYSPNDSPTRFRNPEVKFAPPSSKTVVNSNPAQHHIGPGAYDDGKKFGDDAKTFKIREPSREKPADPNGGPGQYNPNDSPTKYRNPEIDFGKQSDKPRGIPVVESNVGPGAYHDNKRFGDDAKTFKIRDPSPSKPADPSGGPG